MTEQDHYASALGAERTPEGRLLPQGRVQSEEFWKSTREHALALQRCSSCGTFRYYPTPICPECWSRDYAWEPVTGNGAVYSFTWVYRPARGFESHVPYAYALVELEEGPVLPSNIVNVEVDALHVDLPVEVMYLDLTDEVTIPSFQPRRSDG